MDAVPTAEQLAVDDRLCVALATASRAMTACYRSLLEPLGVTYPQYIALSWLWQEGELAVSTLAELMELDRSTLSPLVKRLELTGHVRRQRDPRDERRVVVSLTTSGSALQKEAVGIPEAIGRATGLSLTDQQALVASLRRLAQTLDAASV